MKSDRPSPSPVFRKGQEVKLLPGTSAYAAGYRCGTADYPSLPVIVYLRAMESEAESWDLPYDREVVLEDVERTREIVREVEEAHGLTPGEGWNICFVGVTLYPEGKGLPGGVVHLFQPHELAPAD
jgi:hypothetical protein